MTALEKLLASSWTHFLWLSCLPQSPPEVTLPDRRHNPPCGIVFLYVNAPVLVAEPRAHPNFCRSDFALNNYE